MVEENENENDQRAIERGRDRIGKSRYEVVTRITKTDEQREETSVLYISNLLPPFPLFLS